MGENVPAVAGSNKAFVANEKYCNQPGAAQFHGRIDKTRVLRVMATALGLGGS